VRIQACHRANETRRAMCDWAEVEIAFSQLPSVARAERLLERYFCRDEAVRSLQRCWAAHHPNTHMGGHAPARRSLSKWQRAARWGPQPSHHGDAHGGQCAITVQGGAARPGRASARESLGAPEDTTLRRALRMSVRLEQGNEGLLSSLASRASHRSRASHASHASASHPHPSLGASTPCSVGESHSHQVGESEIEELSESQSPSTGTGGGGTGGGAGGGTGGGGAGGVQGGAEKTEKKRGGALAGISRLLSPARSGRSSREAKQSGLPVGEA